MQIKEMRRKDFKKVIRFAIKGMRFEELRKVLESYGYTMKRPSGGSSHCTFRKEGRNPITIPIHEPIKTVYVQMVKEVIETEENYENN